MNVTDMAGNVSHAERQLIIDKENPVIAHVDELDGKYLKKFSWNYSIEESIKDFTNYTYVMKVDDALYRPGERLKEGVHVLVSKLLIQQEIRRSKSKVYHRSYTAGDRV